MKRRRVRTASAVLVLAASWTVAAMTGCGPEVPRQRTADRELVAAIREEITAGAGGGAAAATRPDPTGWATLKGTFKFDPSVAGRFTDRPELTVTGGDAAYCTQGGVPESSALLVNSSGAIENVVIFLGDDLSDVENKDLWLHPSASPGENTETVEFDQEQCVFLKPVVTMQVSQPLLILNSDGVGHNTKLENANPISEIIPPGGRITYEHRREERQPYPVSCNIHPWMKAYILVRNNGYFAQTDEQGQFVIENLPAGVDLTMKVWHEKVGFVQDVTVNGEQKSWSKRGFPINLPADGEMNLDVTVDPGPFEG